jgi:hypothetical protein
MPVVCARVSTANHNLSLQRDGLNVAGCKKLFPQVTTTVFLSVPLGPYTGVLEVCRYAAAWAGGLGRALGTPSPACPLRSLTEDHTAARAFNGRAVFPALSKAFTAFPSGTSG